jgi:REP element-mobilizing transposase RayT
MKQRHSFCRLAFHVVLHSKYRQPMISTPEEVEILLTFMKSKAHELDSYIEVGGGWRDHIHLLLQSRPTIRLSELYGQLKGYSTTMWRRRFLERPSKWGDGVFAKTIDPDRCDELRTYIKYQWPRQEQGLVLNELES